MCHSPCPHLRSPASFPEGAPASPVPRRALPSRWLRILRCPRSARCDSPQQISAITQLGLLAVAFARQLGVGIGLRFMGFIRPLLHRESLPSDCRDRLAKEDSCPPSAEN